MHRACPPPPSDPVDHALAQWQQQLPGLDTRGLAITLRLVLLGKLIERHAAASFAGLGVEAWEVDVLAALRRQGPPYALTAGELAGQILLTCSGLSHRLNRLQQRGLIRRETDPADRRRVRVRLTPAGRRLIEDLVPLRAQASRALLAALDAGQRDLLEGLLQTLLAALSTPPSAPPPDPRQG